ncbi:MAG TPA: FosX/FosE/FosI family fosfomycin resistance hydrolase [Clostridia bacterium]|nr:FosX/FosE/FosI family fosfomycin resistance hydrolase [Clostridia bacterium]
MIKGISHLTFIVHDLEKATLFFEKIFAAEVVYDSGAQLFSVSKERYFRIGELWIAAMEGEALPAKTYNHIAFQIAECDFEEYEKRIKDLGLERRTPRGRVEGEGRSLYFYDYDNHLFELHTGTLGERLTAYNSRKKAK